MPRHKQHEIPLTREIPQDLIRQVVGKDHPRRTYQRSWQVRPWRIWRETVADTPLGAITRRGFVPFTNLVSVESGERIAKRSAATHPDERHSIINLPYFFLTKFQERPIEKIRLNYELIKPKVMPGLDRVIMIGYTSGSTVGENTRNRDMSVLRVAGEQQEAASKLIIPVAPHVTDMDIIEALEETQELAPTLSVPILRTTEPLITGEERPDGKIVHVWTVDEAEICSSIYKNAA